MISIKAKKDFTYKGKDYFMGDEIKMKDVKDIGYLNEKGFIEPLTLKELSILEKEIRNDKEVK